MPVYRIAVNCTVTLNGGGTAHEKYLAILDGDTPMRDLAKHFTERFNINYRKRHGLCIIEEVLDGSGGWMELVGLVRECLKSDEELSVKGRQLSKKAIEQAAFSWFFSPPAITTPLITQELTTAMRTTLAQALTPALIPSLIPALVPALAPALAPALLQSVAALRGSSPSPPQPRSDRLIASSHNKSNMLQDTESESETTTMNEDIGHVSEENSSESSSESDEDMDRDSSSESEDERPKAVVEEKEIQEESSSEKSSLGVDNDEDDDEDEDKKEAVAQIVKKDVQMKEIESKKDVAEIMKDNDNALVDMFKDDVHMDSDSDSSSDEDEVKSSVVVPQVVSQTSVTKVEPQVKETKDTINIISKPLVPAHFAPSLALPKSPKPDQVKTATSPAKVVATKPIISSGLESLLLAQSPSSSSASSSPASSRSSSPTPAISPAPSPAPIPRQESASNFAAPAVVANTSPLPKKVPLSDASSSSSPYRAFTALVPATSPAMSRTTSTSSSSSALKRPAADQSRRIVSPERPKKKQAGFAIAIPQDPFRAPSPEVKSEYNSDEESDGGDIRSSQDFLFSALSRLPRTPSPVEDEEEDVPIYIPLNLVVKQEEEEEDHSDDEQVRRDVIPVKIDDQQEDDGDNSEKEVDEPLTSEATSQKPMSITSSSEPTSSQVSPVDVKEESLSQNLSSELAQYQKAEEQANNTTATASALPKLSTTPRIAYSEEEEDEEEDERLSPVVSPPGALLKYLKSSKPPAASPKEQQPNLSTTPKYPLSAPASPAPALVPVPAPLAPIPTTPSKSLSDTMAAYPTFASLASLRGPDVSDPTSNTDEIVAFLDKDMEGLSRDSSLTGPPYFLPARPPVPAHHPNNNVTVTRVAATPPLGDESTVSPELRPSVSPMVVPKIDDYNKDEEMGELDLGGIHKSHLLSDSEDSIFNIPSAQPPTSPGTEIAAVKAPNGWVNDTRDAMDDFQFSDEEERNASLKRRMLEMDKEDELSESEYEQKPTDIPEGMFGPNRIRPPGQPEYRYETVFKDTVFTPSPSQKSVVQTKRPRLSSPSSSSASSSGSDSDSSDASSDEDDDKGIKEPHPLDALDELPMMISSQSSLPSMPTLTSLSQGRTTKTKKMGSLEMALKQHRGDDDEEDDDNFAITIKRTGPTAVGRGRDRGVPRGAASAGRGGVTIAASGGRAGSVSSRGKSSGGGLEDLFA
ncbi:hypothetical protein BGZ47_011018 [Haplosporangium gracile]|nr:hypothetical protein BGZ47_011018 [Haplosporangium gracile]